jgi:hypothetical protein
MNSEKRESRGLSYILLSALALFFGYLFSKRSTPIDNSVKAPHQQSISDKESEYSELKLSPTSTVISNTHPSPERDKKANDDWTKIRKWGDSAIGFLTLLAVTWYACVATKQRDEARQANVLTRQMITATMAAVFNIHSDFPTDDAIRVYLENSGKVTAGKLEGTAQIILRERQEGIDLAQQTIDIHEDAVRPTAMPIRMIPMHVPKFPEMADSKTIILRVSISYCDGFGNKTAQRYCSVYVVRKTPSGEYNARWDDCDSVRVDPEYKGSFTKPLPIIPGPPNIECAALK